MSFHKKNSSRPKVAAVCARTKCSHNSGNRAAAYLCAVLTALSGRELFCARTYAGAGKVATMPRSDTAPAVPQPGLLVQIFYECEFKPARLSKVVPQTLQQYESSIRRLSTFLGRAAMLGDLTDNTLTAWMSTCGDYGLSRRTIKWRRTALNAICRLALERGLLPVDFPFMPARSKGRPGRESRPRDTSVGPGMALDDFVDVYVEKRNAERPIGRDLSKDSRRHLAEAVQAFSVYLGRPTRLSDLTATNINGFLASQMLRGLSPYSVKNRRTAMMVLLRRALRMKLIQNVDPHEVRTVFCPRLSPSGYDLADAERLISFASTLRCNVRRTGVPRAAYWVSAILVEWNLGIRIGDLTRIEVKHFSKDGTLFVAESKTGKSGIRALHNSTRIAIERCIATEKNRRLIWPGFSAKTISKAFTTIARNAGLPGTSRWLRRGSSSEVDRTNPGAAWRFLNHSTPALFEKHYRVDRISTPDPLSPPEIALPELPPAAPKPRGKRGAA